MRGEVRWEPMDDTGMGDVARFRLTYSLDRDGFFRRACPSCGREFKTRMDQGDLRTLLQPMFERAGLEIGARGTTPEEENGREHLNCPYCGQSAEPGEMMTHTFLTYVERCAMREVVLPSLDRLLSGVSDEFRRSSRGRVGGLIGMRLNFQYERPVSPVRPISGPEPPDMMAVRLLCCGERIKVADGWRDPITCPHCGTLVVLQ